METTGCKQYIQRNFEFKSYYVVWKPLCSVYNNYQIPCLNRTMQYGNALISTSAFVQISAFKSYYVVWKPQNQTTNIIYIFLFKSYYVVWKLFLCRFLFFLKKEFKSYYVVWKPVQELRPHSPPCLFKSYYVVWKPYVMKYITKEFANV